MAKEDNLPDWSTADPVVWAEARRREQVLRRLCSFDRIGAAAITDAANELQISIPRVYQLIEQFRSRPVVSTLLVRSRGRRFGDQRLTPRVEELIEHVFKKFAKGPGKVSGHAHYREVRRLCIGEGLKSPAYRTVKSRVAKLRELTGLTPEGKKKPRVVTKSYVSPHALAVVQIDHALVDVIVVDELERLPIGRPWLTIGIDVCTRVIAGFSLSLDAPSSLSVALALTHMVAPKDLWLADRGVDGEWPVAGLPDAVHFDNAKEFHADALVRGAEEYGIEMIHRPIARPHYGGHIERLIGTLMGAVHLLPGTTDANPQKRGDYDSAGKAVMTLPELEKWIALEITGVYHQALHGGIGQPPIAAWRREAARRLSSLRQPPDPSRFFIDFLPGEQRRITREGIQLFNIRYWSNVLAPMIESKARDYLVKYDPRDLSRIYLCDRQNQYWPLSYRDLAHPPISLWELREAKRRMRELGRSLVNETALFQAVAEQQSLVSSAQAKTRARRRQERDRLHKIASSQEPGPDKDSTPASKDSQTPPKLFPIEEWS